MSFIGNCAAANKKRAEKYKASGVKLWNYSKPDNLWNRKPEHIPYSWERKKTK